MSFKFFKRTFFIIIFIGVFFIFIFFIFKEKIFIDRYCCKKRVSVKEKAIKNVGIIMDGNRRWAKKNGFPLEIGYRRGAEKLIEAIEFCLREGLESLTVYALSYDNLTKRSEAENKAIFNAAMDFLNKNRAWFRERKILVNVIGEIDRLPREVKGRIDDFILENNCFCSEKKFILNMLIAYGALEDILFGLNKFEEKRNKKLVKENGENLLKSIRSSVVPMLDLVVRTGYHKRLSGFLPLQSIYAEVYFLDCLWPDFDVKFLRNLIEDASAEERSFGK
jgi:undecaprenyl diphosphate synthase